jgi:outer membrane translocation and assembly module TamA
MLGDGLPEDAMRKAAEFRPGQIADWTQIQLGIYQSEGPLKRTGYFRARSKFERKLHEDTHVLDVDITYDRGPLFHFGNILFTGLAPADEARARTMWRRAPGDAYDYAYPSEFLREFGHTLDGRVYKSFDEKAKPGLGDHVMDVELIFTHR